MTTLSHTYIPRRLMKQNQGLQLSFSSETPKIPTPSSVASLFKNTFNSKKKKLLLLHGIPGSSDYLFGEEQLHYHYIYVHILTYLYILLVMLSLIIEDYVI